MDDSGIPSGPPPDYSVATAGPSIASRLRQSAPVRRGPLPLELPILTYLKGKRVILASASPRRKALLTQVRTNRPAPLPTNAAQLTPPNPGL